MRHILLFVTLSFCFQITAQTGSLTLSYYVSLSEDYETDYAESYSVKLKNDEQELDYPFYEEYDTIRDIPVGKYELYLYAFDSKAYYVHLVQIKDRTTTDVYINTDCEIIYNSEFEDTIKAKNEKGEYINASIRLGTGLVTSSDQYVINSFSFSERFNFDHRLGDSPIALGFEYGFEYSQVNYTNQAFGAPGNYVDRQVFSYVNVPFAFTTSIYIRDKKLLDLGMSYHLPLLSRISQLDGNQKLKTKKVHNFNDIRYFAHLGYSWGFLFAEYRATQFLKSNFEDMPNINLGARFLIPIETY